MAKRKKTKKDTIKPVKPVFFWGILGLYGAVLVFRKITDVDIWWHMQLGRDLVTRAALPDLSSYYWTPSQAHAIHEFRYTWLGDVFFYLVHSGLGAFGLQCLVFALLMATVVLAFSMGKGRRNGATLLVLLVFMNGVYQWTIPRNAVFGLIFVMLLFAIWQRERVRPGMIWWQVLLLGIWSCCHGSYLLGFGLSILIATGLLIDDVIEKRAVKRAWFHRAASLMTGYLLILIGNQVTLGFSRRVVNLIVTHWALAMVAMLMFVVMLLVGVFPHRFNVRQLNLRMAASCLVVLITMIGFFLIVRPYLDTTHVAQASLRGEHSDGLGFFGAVKHGLNNTIWTASVDQFQSLDFRSPFDFKSDINVWSNGLLLLMTLFAFFRGRRHFVDLVPLIPVIFIAAGYLRATAILALLSLTILVPYAAGVNRRYLNKMALVGSGFLCLLLLMNAIMGIRWLGLHEYQPGFGASGFFPHRVGEELRDRFPKAKPFTTVQNGGFLLFKWRDKPVFIDGFYLPHTGQVVRDYRTMMDSGDLSILDSYAADVAVVGVLERELIPAFFADERWLPTMMDRSSVVFSRAMDGEAFALLFEVEKVPESMRAIVALRLFEAVDALASRGKMKPVNNLFVRHQKTINLLSPYAPGALVAKVVYCMSRIKRQYGNQNHDLIPLEYSFHAAFVSGNGPLALALGEQLLGFYPGRSDLLADLIKLARQSNDQGRIQKYQSLIQNQSTP